MLASRGELPLILQRPVRGPLGQAVVALLTPAGALFDGDVVDLNVECEAGTDVTLTTAAATKLNRCDGDGIEVRMRVHVADSATFRYLPHEVIPFAGARYHQRIDMEIAPGASAALLEVIAPGASDAPFTYASLQFLMEVHIAGALKVRERFMLRPRSVSQFGGFTHYGSVLGVGVPIAGLPQCESNIQLGMSALPVDGGVVVKALGHSSQAVRSALMARLHNAEWLNPLMTS